MARNSGWFIALFAPVVIGRSNYFRIGFSTVISKPLYVELCSNQGHVIVVVVGVVCSGKVKS